MTTRRRDRRIDRRFRALSLTRYSRESSSAHKKKLRAEFERFGRFAVIAMPGTGKSQIRKG
jgi:hypothetical protein